MRLWPVLTLPTVFAVVTAVGISAGGCDGSHSSSGKGSSSDGGVTDGGQDATTDTGGASGSDGGGMLGGDGAQGGPCKAKTCSELGYTCGINADGCGNVIDCGACT